MNPIQLSNLLVEQSKDLIWMIDNDLQLIYANKSYLKLMKEMTGVEKKLNEPILVEGFDEGYIEKWKAYYDRSLKGEYFQIEEHFFHRPSNKTQYSQVTFEPLTGDDDKIVAVACQSKDITRIVKERSEANQLIDASLDVFCSINEHGNFVFVSAAATPHWGYLPEELIGKPYFDFILEEDIPKTNKIQSDILNGQEIKSFVNRYKKKDGSIAYNIWSVKWDYTTKLMYCVARDAKEIIEQEEKIEQSEQRFKALVQEGSDMISIIDADGKYCYTTPTTTAILGITPEEFESNTIFDFIHPDDIESASSYMQQISHENKVVVAPFRLRNKNNEWRWIETVLTNMMENPAVKGFVANSRDITEKIELDKKNQLSEQRFKALVQEGSDLIGIIDQEGKYIYVSPTSISVLGINPEEFIGKSPFEFIHPDDVEKTLQSLQKIATENKVLVDPFRFQNDKKEWRWIETVLTNMLENPSVNGIVANSRDITERRKAEKELVEAFSEKNSILERITEAFVSLDKNWCYTYMNKKAGEIFNRDPEKMVGKHIWTEFPEGLNQAFHLAYEKAMLTQEYVHVEEHYKPYDLWFENHIYPSPEGLSIFFRDISERKRNEEIIIQSNERFEKVTEATNDGIWDWNIVDDTFYRSNVFENFFGIDVQKSLTEVDFWKEDNFHPQDIQKIRDSIQQAIADPLTTRWELEYRIFDQFKNILYVIDRGVIIRDNTGKAIRMVGAMSNITEQREMTLQLSELNRSLEKHTSELERSNEELEQFAFVASHDLQEPLRMVSSFMDLLERKYGDRLDEKGHQYIHFATNGAKRMKQIILDLLEYSRANKPTDGKEEVDMNEILSEFKQLRRKVIAEKKASITSDALPILKSYKASITQILHCLLDNALKYSKENNPPMVEINVIENEKEWEFSIKDNGIGIDSQFYDKIFIIFQRLHNKDRFEGTGIGLSIVKKHLEFLGGKIWLKSKVGEGSVFYFTIPKFN